MVQRVLNHADLDSTAIYTKVHDAQVIDAIGRNFDGRVKMDDKKIQELERRIQDLERQVKALKFVLDQLKPGETDQVLRRF